MTMLQTKKHTYERVRWYVVCFMVLLCTSFSDALSAAQVPNMGGQGITTDGNHSHLWEADSLFDVPFLPNKVNNSQLTNSSLLHSWDDQGSMQLSNEPSPFCPVVLSFNSSPRHDEWSNYSDIPNIPSPPLWLGNEDASVSLPEDGMVMPLIMPETMATTTTITRESSEAIRTAPSSKKRKTTKKQPRKRQPVLTTAKKKDIGLKKGVKQQNVRHQKKKKFACDICNKSFTQKSNLTTHIKGVHLKEKRYQCAYCQKGFSQKIDLKRHMLKHTGERPYACSLCNKSFIRNQNLKKHVQEFHANNKSFACVVCNSKYAEKKNLVAHMKRSHFQQGYYKCPKCSKSFTRSDNLKIHIQQIHTKSERFVCTVCNKSYAQKKSLTRHQKSAHAEQEKCYKCAQCNKSFTRAYNLKKHMSNHL